MSVIPVKRDVLLRMLRLLGVCALLLLVFVASLTAVYALPQQTIPTHLRESAAVLRAEGVYPSRIFEGTPFLQDNYTDALMLDMTFRQPSDSPLVAAMAGAHGGAATIVALAQTATGVRSSVSHYSYYWSGYEVVLRPLVILFNYSQIRLINLVTLLILTSAVSFLLWQMAGWKAVVAFLASLLVCGFIIVPWSLQYSNMTYLMLFAMVAVLVALKRGSFQRLEWETFFIVGMLAAFFDLLTTPLLTLGMPLVIVLIARSKSSTRSALKSQAFQVLTASALWSVGYIVSWLAKLAIGQAILRESLFTQAAQQFFFRAGSIAGVSRAEVMALNFKQMYPMYLVGKVSPVGLRLELAVGAVVFLAVAIMFVDFFRRAGRHVRLDPSAAALFVVPLPYIWYSIASNHSYIHARFTYRIQAVAVFALLYFVFSVVESMVAANHGDATPTGQRAS